MNNTLQERVRLSVAEARALAEQALARIGYDAEEARIVADHVIDAALRETAVSVRYDGGNNVGMVTMYHAAHAAIAKAREHGFSLVGVNNSWVSGRGAYYVEMIARAGLLVRVSVTRPIVATGIHI